MKVIASTGREDIAVVYIVELENGKLVECVESVQPPFSRLEKWIILVSTLYGCPVGCAMCDAGGYYQGKLSAEDILNQIDFMVKKRFADGKIPCRQFKIQFARMGEPALNLQVLDVLETLPRRYDAPGLIPSISTIAPAGSQNFFERLLRIKKEYYSEGSFQFQFSLHTTDQFYRNKLIPIRTWTFAEMAAYGERFYAPGDRKITLNFALARGIPLETEVLLAYFSPDKFLVKITPVNPTYRSMENQLISYIDPEAEDQAGEIVQALRAAGYTVIVSIGQVEENQVGSNCGQYLRTHLSVSKKMIEGYTFPIIQNNNYKNIIEQ
ncbi:MAG: radical SAM protein [Chloroflexi bacterium]|nr:radical SAM protein [Chloroflexota bacterium]